MQREYLCDNPVACQLGAAINDRARGFCIAFRYDLDHAALLDGRIARDAQRGEQDLVGDILAHRGLRDDVHGAGDARVDDECLAGVSADGLHDRRNVRIHETHRDGILGSRRLNKSNHKQCGDG